MGIIAAQAVLLAVGLLAFVLLRALVRRLAGRADLARSHVRRRIDDFMEG